MKDEKKKKSKKRKSIEKLIGIEDRRIGLINEKNKIYIGRIVEIEREEIENEKKDKEKIILRIDEIRKIDNERRVGIEK